MESIAEYVARVIEKAPPMTDEQASRIASLLRPYGGKNDGATKHSNGKGKATGAQLDLCA